MKQLFIALMAIISIASTSPLCGQSPYIWRTIQTEICPDDELQVVDVDNANANVIVAIGYGLHDLQSHIVKTVDGGHTWNTIYSCVTVNKYIRQVEFPSPEIGFFCADSQYLVPPFDVINRVHHLLIGRTTDGGETWLSSEPGPPSTEHYVASIAVPKLSMFDNEFGAAVIPSGYSRLYVTTNGGIDWTEIGNYHPPGWEPYPIIVHNAIGTRTCFILISKGPSGMMSGLTSDGGQTWNYVEEPFMGRDSGFFSFSARFVDSKNGWLIAKMRDANGSGTPNSVERTYDGGLTWHLLYKGYIGTDKTAVNDFQFSDTLNGIAATSSSIARTTDGGRTWNSDSIDNTENLGQLFLSVSDVSNALAIGINNHVYKSSANSGVRWAEVTDRARISPNPARREFQFCTDQIISQSAILTVQDDLGRIVQTIGHNSRNGSCITVPLERIAAGHYFLRLVDRDKSYTSSLIVE